MTPELWCPFEPAISPLADAVSHASGSWIERFALQRGADHTQRRSAAQYGILAARAYPRASLEALQIASDWVTWLFVMDDHCDESELGRDHDALERVHRRMVAILRGAPPTDADLGLVHALADLRARIAERASAASLARFVRAAEDYFAANRWEVVNRQQGVIPLVSAYQQMRLRTGAVLACFELTELTDGIVLPEEAHAHPAVDQLRQLANGVICWCNDILSVAKERDHGDVHNLVIVIQNERGLSDVQALDDALAVHDASVRAFVELSQRLPRFGGDVDAALARYADCLRWWMRANLDWSLTALRYARAAAANDDAVEELAHR